MPLRKLFNSKLIARVVAVSFAVGPLPFIWSSIVDLFTDAYVWETFPLFYLSIIIFSLPLLIVAFSIWHYKAWGYAAGSMYAIAGLLVFLLEPSFFLSFSSDIPIFIFFSPVMLGLVLPFLLADLEKKLLWKKFIKRSTVMLLSAFGLFIAVLLTGVVLMSSARGNSLMPYFVVPATIPWIFLLTGWFIWREWGLQLHLRFWLYLKTILKPVSKRIDGVIKLGPWFSIWTKPRDTIRSVLNTTSEQTILLLAGLGGIFDAFSRAVNRSAGDSLSDPMLIFVILFLGFIGGIIMLYLGSFLVGWTGRWIGGKATFSQLRVVYAWASVPFIWLLPLVALQVLIFGSELFLSLTPRIDASMSLTFALLATALIEVAVSIWAFILLLKMLGEVQGFSAWKALLNIVLGGLVFTIPLILLGVFTVFLF